MTKQRSQPKPIKSKAQPPAAGRLARSAPHDGGAGAQPEPDATSLSSSARSPAGRSTEAVALYERGLEALQRHDYPKATQLLESVLRQYPEEKELHERVRLYLNVCQRQSTRREDEPRSVDERLYAATLAINGGKYDEALVHLRLVRDEDPDSDHALYMLAVAHAQRGEHAEAVVHLERAIALNPENRAIARRDPDLEPLRDDDAFRSALDTPGMARGDRRRPNKSKTAR
jgi:outer membrane protein assembly factor BamD (BamD/ComL family)